MKRWLTSSTDHWSTVGLLVALGLLMTALGGIFFGELGLLFTGGLTAVLLWGSSRVPVEWLLRSQRAEPITAWQAPELHRIVEALARRAGLRAAPRLYLVPSPQPNAFTVGEDGHAAIALSAGMLRLLDDRELTGVLAHEIAHVRNRDTRTLRLAATFNSVVGGLTRAGWLVLLLSLPLVLLGEITVPSSGVLLLVLGPWLGQALQLALSRTREYAADDAAVGLTGDPEGLARALSRLEARQRGLLGRLFGLGAPMIPEWMRTHPPTEARVRRLMARGAPAAAPAPLWTARPAARARPAAGPVYVDPFELLELLVRRPPRRGPSLWFA